MLHVETITKIDVGETCFNLWNTHDCGKGEQFYWNEHHWNWAGTSVPWNGMIGAVFIKIQFI